MYHRCLKKYVAICNVVLLPVESTHVVPVVCGITTFHFMNIYTFIFVCYELQIVTNSIDPLNNSGTQESKIS